MKFAAAFLSLAFAALSVVGQTQNPPTLRIVTEDPNLPSELFYGDVKIKPLRLRPGTNQRITIGDNDFFVQQQYVDFLSRMPDSGGFTEWQRVLNTCTNQGGLGADPACDRVHVSSGFFRSPEFQGRGYFVYRFYETSFGRRPQYAEFTPDLRRVSGPQSPAEEEVSKVAFINDFIARSAFRTRYDNLSNAQFVDTLIATAGVTLSSRNQLVSDLDAGRRSRAQVLRTIVESAEIANKFFNRAFVAMQYFGYLLRDPDEAGYNEWLRVLNTTGDFRQMIFGFIYSAEYRGRFGQP